MNGNLVINKWSNKKKNTKHIVIYNSCLTSVYQIIDLLQVVHTFTTSLPQSSANDELTTHLRLVCV